MQRFELKFIIRQKDVASALSHLRLEGKFVKSYDVNSVYFDDKNLSSYHAKLDGNYERHKIRIRTYSRSFSDSTLYLELKKRSGSLISKKRHEISASTFTKAMAGRSSEPWLVGLNPTLTVYYQRHEFIYPWGRVTLDSDITFKSERFEWKFKESILEVKTESVFQAHWMKWLSKMSVVQSFSKYATGMKMKLGEVND